ncbi:ATP-binding protein [Nocardia sp. NPDC060256]|uniref:ATP-binding protein n=1 Tax=unclassified Nocardia TaxID=2637762 RepID=UPI00365A8BE3
MAGDQFINVTPHPRILGVLGDIEFSQWQCLAELADNCFDEFQAAGEAVHRPSVTITLPPASSNRASAEITVRDNGRGMSLTAVTNAISAGWTSNSRHGSLGLFGMGFNISTARLGRRTTVRTSRAGDPEWIEVTLDLTKIANSSKYLAPYRTVPKANPSEHGTTVTISELKQDQHSTLCRPRTQSVIRDKLGDVYSYLLREKGFLLTLNGKKVQPRVPCIWDAKRTVTRQGVEIHAVQQIDHVLSSKKACMTCGYWSSADAEQCEECGQDRIELRERRIWGWVGVQRYVHTSDYGIDFLRNGRKILQRDKRVFYWQDEDDLGDPELEYPIDSKKPTGRIIGEIHCDHVSPNYQKTAFEFETTEWRQVLREVRGTSPIRPQIAKRLGLPENRSPLALLFAGFRRQDPGLNYLIPGDGHNPLHEKAAKWADLMRNGDLDYQTDEMWYQAARQHDHPVEPDLDPTSGEILPGLNIDSVEVDPMFPTDETRGKRPFTEKEPPAETVNARLQRYRDHAEALVDLTGKYLLDDLGSVELTVWAVRGQELVTNEGHVVPVAAMMLRAPTLEVFVNAGHKLFSQFGTDMRDMALVEVAEFMRARVNRKIDTPLTEIVGNLKAQSSRPQLTVAAVADESERLLERVRAAMVIPVSTNPSSVWELLTNDERASTERSFAVQSGGWPSWDDARTSGEFIRYIPASAITRIIKASPELFLDGHVFKHRYQDLTDASAKALVLDRVIGPLGDLTLLDQHSPRLDSDELSRTRISCRLITRDLADDI